MAEKLGEPLIHLVSFHAWMMKKRPKPFIGFLSKSPNISGGAGAMEFLQDVMAYKVTSGRVEKA